MTGLSNLVHLYTLSLIVDQNILTLIWHIFVHLWVLDTLLEHLTPLGLMDWLVDNQNKNLGTHIRMFLQNTPKDWAHQVHMYAFAHNSQPLFSALNVSPHELVFHIRPRILLTFDLNLNRNKNNTCTSQYCSQLPEHSHYDKTYLNPFFYRKLSKPTPQWFLAVETAMLQIYSIIHNYTLKKINSQTYKTKTYHEGKLFPLGTFVFKRNFIHVHFSD